MSSEGKCMKALKCEMCNGNDFVKQDGLYVCQFCGTKYTADEAKKLMIDGEVEVKGVMTLDKLAKNGEMLLKLGKHQDAKNVFHKLSCDYPEDYRGWWGMARAESAVSEKSLDVQEYIKAALAVAPKEEKERLEKESALLLKKLGVKNSDKAVKALEEPDGKRGSKKLFGVLTVLFFILLFVAAVVTGYFIYTTGAACVDDYRNGFDLDWFKPALLTVVFLAITILFGLLASIFRGKRKK